MKQQPTGAAHQQSAASPPETTVKQYFIVWLPSKRETYQLISSAKKRYLNCETVLPIEKCYVILHRNMADKVDGNKMKNFDILFSDLFYC